MKRISALLLAGATAFSMSACGIGDIEIGGGGKSCPMSVITSFGGTDMSGKELESGEFTETFDVSAGDFFRESDNGHWLLNSGDKKFGIIAEIKKVDDDGVTFMIGNAEMQTSYGAVSGVRSLISADDGVNYSYMITFGSQPKPLPELTSAPETMGAPDKNTTVTCDEQGFSTVMNERMETKFTEGDGLYIYIEPDNAGIPYLLIYRMGALPVGIGQFIEETYIAGAIEDYGDDLISSIQYEVYDIAGGQYPAAKLLYKVKSGGQEFRVTSLRVYAQYDGEYVSFTAKYTDSGEEAALLALETAIKNFRLDSAASAGAENPSSGGNAPENIKITVSEAASVKYVKYQSPDGYFTADIPQGWEVYLGLPQGGGYPDIISYPITIYDPSHPERKAFSSALLITKARSYPAAYEAFEDPALHGALKSTGYTVEEFFGDYGNYLAVNAPAYGFTDLVSQGDLDQFFMGKFIYASCNSSAYGIPLAGVFGHGGSLVDERVTHMAQFFSVIMMTAAEEDAVDWIPVLMHCVSSIDFSDEYKSLRQSQWNASIQNAEYISQTAGSISDMISSSWEARNRSYDIMSQKRSDATLGYERVYDTETGDIYKAWNGFTDSYSGARYQPVNDDMYTKPIAGYIER